MNILFYHFEIQELGLHLKFSYTFKLYWKGFEAWKRYPSSETTPCCLGPPLHDDLDFGGPEVLQLKQERYPANSSTKKLEVSSFDLTKPYWR